MLQFLYILQYYFNNIKKLIPKYYNKVKLTKPIIIFMEIYFDSITNSKSTRCQCKNYLNNKRCLNKHKTLYFINKKYVCKFHLNHITYVNAYCIQNYYFNVYRNHKKFKNIYLNLPSDIQEKIKYHIHENYYNEKFNNCVIKLVKTKLDENILKNINYNNLEYDFINNNIETYINNISNYINLLNKYYKDLKLNYTEFNNYCKTLKKLHTTVNIIVIKSYSNNNNININNLELLISQITLCENNLYNNYFKFKLS